PSRFPRLEVAHTSAPPLGQSYLPLQDDRVLYDGQPIAVAIAETLEQAEHAAQLVHPVYQCLEPRRFGAGSTRLPRQSGFTFETDEQVIGNVEAGFAEAGVVVNVTYTLPICHHNPMEPCATVAEWDGDTLTLHTATQWSHGVRHVLAPLFGLPPDK